MTDHRRLQRTLFRMYSDQEFAQAILTHEKEALASTGLEQPDLALLMDLDPRALAADPGGRRRSQLLGNSASEFTLSLAAARRVPELSDLLDGFPSSTDFHTTLATDGRLPLAFGNYALARATAIKAHALQAILNLELALAHLRRASTPPTIPSPHPLLGNWPKDPSTRSSVPEIPPHPDPLNKGCVRLGASMRLVRLPIGSFNWATQLQDALDASEPAPRAPEGIGPEIGREIVLLKRGDSHGSFQLPMVSPELLSSPTDALLSLATAPLSRAERAEFAQSRGTSPETLEAFIGVLVQDGVLEIGATPD